MIKIRGHFGLRADLRWTEPLIHPWPGTRGAGCSPIGQGGRAGAGLLWRRRIVWDDRNADLLPELVGEVGVAAGGGVEGLGFVGDGNRDAHLLRRQGGLDRGFAGEE